MTRKRPREGETIQMKAKRLERKAENHRIAQKEDDANVERLIKRNLKDYGA